MGALRNRVAALFVAAVMAGCIEAPKLNVFVADTDPTGWNSNAKITIPNEDSISMRDLYIFLRVEPQVRRDSLNLRVVTTTPDKRAYAESITIYLRNRSRNHRAATQFVERLYRSDVVWSQVGEYTINIYPTSRARGVEAVGVRIENIENKE